MTTLTTAAGAATPASKTYQELLALFAEWRAFERPPLRDGAPDYTANTFKRRHQELKTYEARLVAIDPRGWPVEQQVDYQLVRAEMNGLDFYIRVLQPWARDPAFYKSVFTEQSDTPAHEGPTQHAAIELWTYSFPLSAEAQKKLSSELRTVRPLLAQAQLNLTGNARDLWLAGTGTMQKQIQDLGQLAEKTPKTTAELSEALRGAQQASTEFVAWLEKQAPAKTGPSGVGKENYTWSLRNVHLVPLTWEEEVDLLKRELARAHASLRLEEQRNRGLPQLPVISSPEEYQQRANEAITKYLAFLKAKEHPANAGLHGPRPA